MLKKIISWFSFAYAFALVVVWLIMLMNFNIKIINGNILYVSPHGYVPFTFMDVLQTLVFPLEYVTAFSLIVFLIVMLILKSANKV